MKVHRVLRFFLFPQYQARIGYCPQTDVVLDLLTGREMLALFGRLRGIQEQSLPEVIRQTLTFVEMLEYADVTVGKYRLACLYIHIINLTGLLKNEYRRRHFCSNIVSFLFVRQFLRLILRIWKRCLRFEYLFSSIKGIPVKMCPGH